MHAIVCLGPDMAPALMFEATHGPFESLTLVVRDKISAAALGSPTQVKSLFKSPVNLFTGEEAFASPVSSAALTHTVLFASPDQGFSLQFSRWTSGLPATTGYFEWDHFGGIQALTPQSSLDSVPSVSLTHILAWKQLQVSASPGTAKEYALADQVFDHVSGRIPHTGIRDKLKEAFSNPLEVFFPTLSQQERGFFKKSWLLRLVASEVRRGFGLEPGQVLEQLHISFKGQYSALVPGIDLLFTFENRLFAGMCLFSQTKKFEPTELREAIFALGAANKLMGLQAIPFLVVAGAPFPDTAEWRDLLRMFDIPSPVTLDLLRDEGSLTRYFKAQIPASSNQTANALPPSGVPVAARG
jgi:hypothetical protein